MVTNPLIAKLQKKKIEIDPDIGDWFRQYRESYNWPSGTSRSDSEQAIIQLQSSIQSSIIGRDEQKFFTSLVEIHRWKTNNQTDITIDYRKTLDLKGREYLGKILDLAPFDTIEKLLGLIRMLKIPNCNLPICSAIASFIYKRQDVPIIDRFVAQFFSRKFKVNNIDEDTARVLQYVKKIPFKLEDGGTGNLRLSVYSDSGFEDNLSKYLEMLIPECNRIAEDLRRINVKYHDIQNQLIDFYPVDVEMAIFSYAMKHSDLF